MAQGEDFGSLHGLKRIDELLKGITALKGGYDCLTRLNNESDTQITQDSEQTGSDTMLLLQLENRLEKIKAELSRGQNAVYEIVDYTKEIATVQRKLDGLESCLRINQNLKLMEKEGSQSEISIIENKYKDAEDKMYSVTLSLLHVKNWPSLIKECFPFRKRHLDSSMSSLEDIQAYLETVKWTCGLVRNSFSKLEKIQMYIISNLEIVRRNLCPHDKGDIEERVLEEVEAIVNRAEMIVTSRKKCLQEVDDLASHLHLAKIEHVEKKSQVRLLQGLALCTVLGILGVVINPFLYSVKEGPLTANKEIPLPTQSCKSVYAKVALLPPTESNNGSKRPYVRFGQDIETRSGVDVLDYGFNITIPGPYIIYCNIQFRPTSILDCTNFTTGWDYIVEVKSPDSAKDRSIMKYTTTCSVEMIGRTGFIGNLDHLDIGEIIRISLSGYNLTYFRSETSYAGVYMV